MAQIHEGRRLGHRDDYKDEDQVILEVTPPAFVASVNSLPDWSEVSRGRPCWTVKRDKGIC